VLASDLQLTPGPWEDLLANAGQGPPAYSRAPGNSELVLARDLKLTPAPREDLLASADAGQGPQAYSPAPVGPLSY
jgi:hypothetical protein